MMNAQQIIDLLQLEPLPIEGGMFRQAYMAGEEIAQAALPGRYTSAKPFSVAIYYLLTNDADSFSALHALPTDEIFHFYLGDPVEMLNLYPDGSTRRVRLGHDLLNGQMVQYVVPRGVWQGCYLLAGGSFALMGTTMAPGFTDDDYLGGERAALAAQYPREADLITRLTRA